MANGSKTHQLTTVFTALSNTVRIALLIGVTTVFIFGALLFGQGVAAERTFDTLALLAALALATALLYLPARALAERFWAALFRIKQPADTPGAAAADAAEAKTAGLVEDLRRLNTEMQRLDSVKTDFVTIASHELRTPLAQIRGYTDILEAVIEADNVDQGQVGSMVASLRKASERMEELISAMLDVSVIDVNAMDLRFAQAPAATVVRTAIEPLQDAMRQRKIYLRADGLKDLPPFQADMQRLVQAFRNVIVNAIKFTPDGGRIEITGSNQPAQNVGQPSILITIKDTGVGIAPENLELIFRKFYRGHDPSLHSTGAYKFMGAGPGLGLTIAKGVIEGHGGRIWAESPGHDPIRFPGATFYILLPITPPANARRVMPFQTGKTVPVVLPEGEPIDDDF
ncbi:MAG: HAMP domain-containing sensor histidine kinase [bacterium]|nr:HAMP domain-containing sensor histidine kinase [bacterium]